MNQTPCNQCTFYEPILKYRGGKRQEAATGWCKRQSTYPEKPWDGANFDEDAKRMPPGSTRSLPVIREGKGIVSSCTDVLKK